MSVSVSRSSTTRSMVPLAGVTICVVVFILGITLKMSFRPLAQELRRQLIQRDARVIAAILQRPFQDSAKTAPETAALLLLESTLLADLPGLNSAEWISSDFVENTLLLGAPRTERLGREARMLLERGEVLADFNGTNHPATLRITAPLGRSHPSPHGFAHLESDATDLAMELTALDRNLETQFWKWFAIAGSITGAGLAIVFLRLARSQRQLAERSEHLAQANRELTLTAKTNAVGAVASHLVHGLKNPVAALQQLVREHTHGIACDTAWQDAAATTRQLREQIDEVTRVLRDDPSLPSYDLEITDLVGHVKTRLIPLCAARRIQCIADSTTQSALPHRTASLVLLILENLATNAAEASPTGGTIRIQASENTNHSVDFLVKDQGPGLSAEQQKSLFTPGLTSKPGGSGLGLAICRQLARNLGAELRIAGSGPQGTTFLLHLSPIDPLAPRLVESTPTPLSHG